MVTEGQQNLETVIFDYLGALREGNQEAVRVVLDPNVTWKGLHEDWVCRGPDEVIADTAGGAQASSRCGGTGVRPSWQSIGDGCPRSLARRGRGRAA